MSCTSMAMGLESLRRCASIPTFPVLIGHCRGGVIALSYAELYPNRVETVILIDDALVGLPLGRGTASFEKFE